MPHYLQLSELRHLLFGFSGRIGRMRFWCGFAFVCLAALAYRYAFLQVFDAFPGVATIYIGRLIKIPLFVWPSCALLVKRLHDRNKPAWWLIPFYFAPILLGKWSDTLPEESAQWWAALAVALMLSVWGLVETGFLPGSTGANRYGEPETGGVHT